MWYRLLFIFLFIGFSFSALIAQTNLPCANFVVGKIVDLPKPNFPIEAKKAKVSGKVEIRVRTNVSGDVTFTEVVSGDLLLRDASIEAAKRAKYSPQTCDGKPMITDGVIVYNFILPISQSYYTTNKIEDFTDITKETEGIESILQLTETANIAFGTSEKKFEPEKDLTRGEFAEFLNRTIEFLDRKSLNSKKNTWQVRIYSSFNPQKLKSVIEIKDFDETRPFAASLQTLFEKYNIAFVNENYSFNGDLAMSRKEIKEYWSRIFGDDSIPINFSTDQEKLITRREFAIFLTESLEVLTYRLSPE
jgi:hypothetical protein